MDVLTPFLALNDDLDCFPFAHALQFLSFVNFSLGKSRARFPATSFISIHDLT